MTGEVDDSFTKSYNPLIVLRLAEVLLNLAEAKAELGTLQQSDIDKTIRFIRDRVGMPTLNVAAANATPDPYLADQYKNVSGANKRCDPGDPSRKKDRTGDGKFPLE